jgi:glycosyltransferase involved in cell wall biosynthesis
MSPADSLVTIAIPTYNRCGTVARAVASALAQTHREIEVVVLDNASTDGTEELVGSLEERDGRLRYVRRSENIGLVPNLDSAFREGAGDYVMLLADDDWIEEGYVEGCLRALRERPELSMAAGRPRNMRDGQEVAHGTPTEMLDPDPAARVRRYFELVDDNAPLHGLVRRSMVRAQPPMRRVLAFDWLWVAGLAFAGGVARIADVAIVRDLGGASQSTENNVRALGLPRVQAKIPHIVIAWNVFAEIGWRSPVYRPLGRRERLSLGTRCAFAVPRRNFRYLVLHLLPIPVQRAATSLSERLRGS